MASVRDRAAYMRDYRARLRVGRPPASRDPDPTPVAEADRTHEACDRRIGELEERIRVLEGELEARPAVIHDDIFRNLDDLL